MKHREWTQTEPWGDHPQVLNHCYSSAQNKYQGFENLTGCNGSGLNLNICANPWNNQQSNSMINEGSEHHHRAHTRENLHHEPRNQEPLRLPNDPPSIHDLMEILYYLLITPDDGIDSRWFFHTGTKRVELLVEDSRLKNLISTATPFGLADHWWKTGPSPCRAWRGPNGPSMGRSNPLIPVPCRYLKRILRIPVIPSSTSIKQMQNLTKVQLIYNYYN